MYFEDSPVAQVVGAAYGRAQAVYSSARSRDRSGNRAHTVVKPENAQYIIIINHIIKGHA